MKCSILIFLLAVILLPNSGRAQSVLEMYLELPSEMLGRVNAPDEPANKDESFRRKVIDVNDNKNGFLSTKGRVHFAKFNRRKGTPILVVSGGSYAEDARKRRLEIFGKNKEGTWEDITKQYYQELPDVVVNALDKLACPKASKTDLTISASGSYRLMLPRTGTTIEAIIDSDRVPRCYAVLFKLQWDGQKFSMEIPRS